jgi:hypothetical protein
MHTSNTYRFNQWLGKVQTVKVELLVRDRSSRRPLRGVRVHVSQPALKLPSVLLTGTDGTVHIRVEPGHVLIAHIDAARYGWKRVVRRITQDRRMLIIDLEREDPSVEQAIYDASWN